MKIRENEIVKNPWKDLLIKSVYSESKPSHWLHHTGQWGFHPVGAVSLSGTLWRFRVDKSLYGLLQFCFPGCHYDIYHSCHRITDTSGGFSRSPPCTLNTLHRTKWSSIIRRKNSTIADIIVSQNWCCYFVIKNEKFKNTLKAKYLQNPDHGCHSPIRITAVTALSG